MSLRNILVFTFIILIYIHGAFSQLILLMLLSLKYLSFDKLYHLLYFRLLSWDRYLEFIIYKYLNDIEIEYTKNEFNMDDSNPKSALMMLNHRFTNDWMIVYDLARKSNMFGRIVFFVKESLKYIPVYGWGLWLSPHILLKRNWNLDKENIKKTLSTFVKENHLAWIILYPEGTRYNEEKRLQSQEYSKRLSTGVLNHVLFPRAKGFIYMINLLRDSQFETIYDITFAISHVERGFGAHPSLLDFYLGRACGYKIYAQVKKYLVKDLPKDDDRLGRWLTERFVEKDAYLEHIRTTFCCP